MFIKNSVTGSDERPVLQPARLASQLIVTQSVTGTSGKPLSTSSTAGSASLYPESEHPNINTVQEIPAFLCPGLILLALTIWHVHCSNGIHNSATVKWCHSNQSLPEKSCI